MLKNEKDNFFCIPVQYMGDYQVDRFEYRRGIIVIGEYKISLIRGEVNIFMYLNKDAEEDGNGIEGFDLIYSETQGDVSSSKQEDNFSFSERDERFNHYYIFIEKYLTDDEYKKIVDEYKKGNVNSRFEIWYDITIDGEEQLGSGMLDDFELFDGIAIDPIFYPPNLNFFKAKYLK